MNTREMQSQFFKNVKLRYKKLLEIVTGDEAAEVMAEMEGGWTNITQRVGAVLELATSRKGKITAVATVERPAKEP